MSLDYGTNDVETFFIERGLSNLSKKQLRFKVKWLRASFFNQEKRVENLKRALAAIMHDNQTSSAMREVARQALDRDVVIQYGEEGGDDDSTGLD